MNAVFRTIVIIMTGLLAWSSVRANTEVDEAIIDNKVITRTYDVYGFNAVYISTLCNVSFIQTTDGTYSLKIRGSEDIISKISVEIKNGVLCLEEARRRNNSKTKVEVIIAAPELHSINSEGVGNFVVKNGLKTKELKIQSSGVGNIIIDNLNCDNLSAILNGVGNIEINGVAEEASFNLNGVGSIKAGNLKANEVKALSSGIGDLKCYAEKSIDISLQGIGSITYSGDPIVKNLRSDGVGKIRKN